MRKRQQLFEIVISSLISKMETFEIRGGSKKPNFSGQKQVSIGRYPRDFLGITVQQTYH